MNDIFKNEDEEDSYENNKYIMSNNEEKDVKIETTSDENEVKNESLNHEINTEETNQIIPVLQYKSNSENQNDNNINNINENILSNEYEEAKMSIKNFLKEKISKQYNKTDNNENEENNILNENNHKNNTDIKNNFTQVQVSNSSLSKGLNNMMINSSRTSGESVGNSIDNYIKMENLYLQDGKINSTGTNYENSNTNNNNITTNNNSNFTPNLRGEKNSSKKNEKKKDKNISKLIKNIDKNNNTPKNIINVIDYNENDDEGENQEKDKEENINTNENDNINNNFNNDNINNYSNTDNNKDSKNNNKTEDENNEYNIDSKLLINYKALDSEAQQKMRNDRANELRIKTINKLRPKIYEEIYKNEYNNIVNKIHREYAAACSVVFAVAAGSSLCFLLPPERTSKVIHVAISTAAVTEMMAMIAIFMPLFSFFSISFPPLPMCAYYITICFACQYNILFYIYLNY